MHGKEAGYMKSIHTVNVSIVVAADQHNPTILHPSFLRSEGIVPKDWEVSEGPICTPAFSLVGFSNGISFRVEQSRLQVIHTHPSGRGTDSLVRELARRYVEKLPHVRYTAVGVNFVTLSECANPDEFMANKFLKEGPWKDENLMPISVGVHLSYAVSPATVHLSLKPGRSKTQKGEDPKTGIVIEGNCHSETQNTGATLSAIDSFKRALGRAYKICATVLEWNGEE